MNLIEEKVGKSLEHISTGENFLKRMPMAQALKSTIGKWDLMELKSFCKARDNVNRTKWPPRDFKTIFTIFISHRDLISKIYKKILTNTPEKQITLLEMGNRAK